MKKRKNLIFIFLFSIFCMFNLSITVSARSGGGHSSSSHSSSGGHGSGIHGSRGSSSRGYYESRESNVSHLIEILIVPLFIILIWKKDTIICRTKISRKSKEAEEVIRRLKKVDMSYSKDMLQNRVEKTYFKMQEAWTSLDLEISKEYMSEDIYKLHNSKLAWMEIRNQRNVLKNIKLLNAKPVGLEHYEDNSKDFIWFYIHGAMIDYTIDETTTQVVDGNTRNSSSVEYWKFIKKNDSWVVDLIMQEDEVDMDRDFVIVSEE
ncbi:TPA: Tim44 domain-containing protein [Clostridium botulinum]|uniref:Tim44 domain-containing protein n=1 Tax=Clostridium TaxID=1485 RepID=UPI0007734220|nr:MULTISPECIES: Tim44-like domain-containing protein [Clostridium]AUM94345.1 transporter [Clostridium sporogenes]AVQ51773.1 Tim44 domain-containing protein [Clostridium botulinum]HBJ2613479.1 Tim44 domain-containing protein [Clostridium botulinum]